VPVETIYNKDRLVSYRVRGTIRGSRRCFYFKPTKEGKRKAEEKVKEIQSLKSFEKDFKDKDIFSGDKIPGMRVRRSKNNFTIIISINNTRMQHFSTYIVTDAEALPKVFDQAIQKLRELYDITPEYYIDNLKNITDIYHKIYRPAYEKFISEKDS